MVSVKVFRTICLLSTSFQDIGELPAGGAIIIPILKIHVALPVFMKCGAGQHKLKVYGTNGRYIIRNGIRR